MAYKTVHIPQSFKKNFVNDIREALSIVKKLEKKFACGTTEPKEIRKELEKVEYLMRVALAKIEWEKLWEARHVSLWLGDNQDWETGKQNLLDLFDAATKDGYLTLDEIKDHAPQHVIEGNQLDRMVAFFVSMGARVFFKPPTEEELEEVKNSPKPDIHINISLWSPDLSIRDWHSDGNYRISRKFLSDLTKRNGT